MSPTPPTRASVGRTKALPNSIPADRQTRGAWGQKKGGKLAKNQGLHIMCRRKIITARAIRLLRHTGSQRPLAVPGAGPTTSTGTATMLNCQINCPRQGGHRPLTCVHVKCPPEIPIPCVGGPGCEAIRIIGTVSEPLSDEKSGFEFDPVADALRARCGPAARTTALRWLGRRRQPSVRAAVLKHPQPL